MRWVGKYSSGTPAPVPAGHVAPPDPPWRYVGSTRVGGPDGRGRSRTPKGVRALGCWFGAFLPQGHVASPDPSQSGERVRGRWPGEVRA